MAKLDSTILAFNRGLISVLGLARVDLKRAAFSAEVMVNWMSRTLGSMMLRPGWGYLGATYGNLTTRNIDFVRSQSAKYVLEFTANIMRVWDSDALVTRPSVSSAVANGNFTTDLTSWTDNDESGAASVWVTGGYMGLTGTGTLNAIRDQTVTVAGANIGVQHALRIVVFRGPVVLRVGTSTTDDSYIGETTLYTGAHSLTLTPTGNFNIRFKSSLERQVLVDSCNIEAAGVMTLPTPWGASDLDDIRAGQESQSIDVMFVGCVGITQRRIERRNATSWSVAQFLVDDGPFKTENIGPVTITGSALSGNITLTASAPLFKSTHAPSTYNAGALFKITSEGQRVTKTITAQNTFTDAIRITGVDSSRIFTEIITGITGTGSTWTRQRSLTSATGPWEDVASLTTDVTETFDDGLDNQIAWYRNGVKTGNYGGGTIIVTLEYSLGSIDGVVRVTGFSSSTSVTAEVLTTLGGTTATDVWAEGEWSDYRGWPSAGGLYESRLWWAGLDKEWGSIVDAFDSHDPNFEGDAGAISRSIGSGPVETINWILPLQRMMLGGLLAEFTCRSSSFDEPLTPTNFNIKSGSTQGSTNVQGKQIDNGAVFVGRGGTKLFQLEFDTETLSYRAKDLTLFVPRIGTPSIVRVAVQRKPDTRIHCVLSNGQVAVLVYDTAESVTCWLKVKTTGFVEDVVVLPGDAGTEEDQVYYTVMRDINDAEVRYFEKWALETECAFGETVYDSTSTATIEDLDYPDGTVVTVRDSAQNFIQNATVADGAITLNAALTYAEITPAFYKLADAHVTFNNAAPVTTVTGLTHLIGEDVVVYQDGICPEEDDDPKTFTVNVSGEITLDTPAMRGVVGLPYTSQWKSAKLGTQLGKMKNVDSLSPILDSTHAKGLEFGPDFDHLDRLSLMNEGFPVDVNKVYQEYDRDNQHFPGSWDPDARICLQGRAPRPVTICAIVAEGELSA